MQPLLINYFSFWQLHLADRQTEGEEGSQFGRHRVSGLISANHITSVLSAVHYSYSWRDTESDSRGIVMHPNHPVITATSMKHLN